MYDINMLLGASESPYKKDCSNRVRVVDIASMGRLVHRVNIDGVVFSVGEMTVGWMFSLFLDAEEFLGRYLLECNTRLPRRISAEQAEMLLKILLKDIEEYQKRAKRQKKGDTLGDETIEDAYIGVAFLVKHLGYTYADVMQMPLRVFYAVMDNAEVIA